MSLAEVWPWSGRDGALRRLRAVAGAERTSKGVKCSTVVAPLLRGAGQRSALSIPPTSVNDIIPVSQRFTAESDPTTEGNSRSTYRLRRRFPRPADFGENLVH